MITRNHRQEVISRAYVHVIAARCGYTCSTASLDYGIDLSILEVTKVGGGYYDSGFKIDVQLKSCTATTPTPTHVQYDLEVDAYNNLVLPNPGTPRILVLLVLPEDEREWTAQSEACLELRRCAYWFSLLGLPPSKNKRTVRVSIPRTNVFSIEQLSGLMERVRRREQL
jgi:hypothetical protein